MSAHAEKKEAGAKRPTASCNLVREDYHNKPAITYAEAAEIAGVSIWAVYKWVTKRKFPLSSRVGPYRIHHRGFLLFLETGMPVVLDHNGNPETVGKKRRRPATR